MHRRLTATVVLALAVMALAPVAGARGAVNPEAVVATTTKGGSCSLAAVLERAGNTLTYGGSVTSCSARFGIHNVTGRAILYEGINTALTVANTPRQHGESSLEVRATHSGKAATEYEGRFDVTVVLNARKSPRRPKHPERWLDPGAGCRVVTSTVASDTLGCTLAKTLPA
jgi:hypothetical protein